MAYYVYIIKSQLDGTLYKGMTADYHRRLQEHNLGLSRYTRLKIPWELIYVEIHKTKSDALIRERRLKRSNRNYLLWLVDQPTNMLMVE